MAISAACGGTATMPNRRAHFVKGDGTFGTTAEYDVGNQPFWDPSKVLHRRRKDGRRHRQFWRQHHFRSFEFGKGKFRAAADYPTGHPEAPYSLVAATLDAGSKPSLAVATAAGTFVLVNKGDGSFHTAVGYDPPDTNIITMDLNGDGRADLILAGDFDGLTWVILLFDAARRVFARAASLFSYQPMVQRGDGNFKTAVGYAFAEYQYGLAVTDFKSIHQPGGLCSVQKSRIAFACSIADTFLSSASTGSGTTPST